MGITSRETVAIGEEVSRALWGKPYYSEKGDGYAGKGKKRSAESREEVLLCAGPLLLWR
ncbi:MAG: hypothetical protein ACLVCH_13200 [Roseburia inulinivorans]